LDTPETLAAGSGYVAVVDSSCVTICWALARPADAVFPAELLLAGELAVELPDELHAARAANEPITAADDSHRLPVSLIAHASQRSGSRPSRER
jgi:hypothetical protein